MKLVTKYHGTREYEKCDVIRFKKGIPGFEDLKDYILFPVEENEVFHILHSIEDESIGIVVASPFNITKNYKFNLDDEKARKLNINDYKDVLVLGVVTLNSDIKKITINLKAPIIINIKDKLGEQIILEEEEYAIKHPLFQEGV